MTGEPVTSAPALAKGDRRLAILLAMAMFVLVVDTSVMNVSIAVGRSRSAHDRQRGSVRDRT